jgi:hypothetical protein
MTLALQTQLSRIGACQEAVEWAGKYETLREAWAACARGDWMFSLCGQMIGKEGWPTHQAIVLAACDCAELALPSYEQRYPADPRVRVCLAITRQWAGGNATIEAVKVAAHAAAYAIDAAYGARLILPPHPAAAYAIDAAYGAYAAAHDAAHAAADVVHAATYAASAAADVVHAAARAAYAAAYYAAADAAHAAANAADAAVVIAAKQCADICRKQLQIGELPCDQEDIQPETLGDA